MADKDKTKQKRKEKQALIPREIREFGKEVFHTQISTKHYKGEDTIAPLGRVAKWESLGVEYLVKATDLEKMKHKKPQVYTEQKKNIYLLTNYVIKQKEENKGRARAAFMLEEYLRDKGYTDKELKRGGKFYDLSKQIIESGAYTNFRKVMRTTDGKQGKEIMGSFYNLIKEGSVDPKTGEIKGKGTQYTIAFNAPYSDYIERGLKENRQFYPIPLKLIADRNVDKNPVLFNFIDYLIYTRGGRTYAKKIRRLLKDIGVREVVIKQRPKDCYKVLQQCLVYTQREYPELLANIEIANEKQDKKMPISARSLKLLEEQSLEDFKGFLTAIGAKDFRECYISFYHRKDDLLPDRGVAYGDEGELISEIMRWLERSIDFSKTKLTKAGTKKFIEDAVRKHLGFQRVSRIYQEEVTSDYPNAFVFLTKKLPEAIKGRKK